MGECVWVIFLLVLSPVLEFKEFSGRKRDTAEGLFVFSFLNRHHLSTYQCVIRLVISR